MQKDLFGTDIISQQPKGRRRETRPMPKPDALEAKEKCKNCVHFFRHTYTDKLKYCRLYKQDNTSYGCLKVKSNTPACIKFESKQN